MPGGVHYLHHRAVVRADKETAKVRPVFDGSAKEKGGKSINDCLYAGPSLLCKMFDILIRLCLGNIVIIADIYKAFLNIEIREEDRDFMRFLFIDREDPTKMVTFRFNRGCFGITSMPFLMLATLKYHMNSLKNKKMELIPFVYKFLRDINMDDLTTAVSDYQEGVNFHDFAKESMKSAGLELRKWESNSPELRNYMNCDSDVGSKSKKILGMLWNSNDEFVYDFVELVKEASKLPFTKRNILRIGPKLFDPPGWISPIIMVAKLYFQKICLDGLGWDETLSGELASSWSKYLECLAEIKGIHVTRYLFLKAQVIVKVISLHGFCDSSSQAYCAVVYVKAGSVTRIIAPKTKIAPIKTLSIPRLELLGCLLLAQLSISKRYLYVKHFVVTFF